IFEHFITNLRKKVKLASIANDHGRRASLKKRRFRLWKKVSELTNIRRIKKNLYKKERFDLLKKVSELSIQCSFRDGVIMFSLENNEPMVWPSPDEIFEHFITNLRKKVKLASIANDHGRRASLKKRRFRLWKKVSELTNIRRIKKNLYKKERFDLLKKVSELSIQCSFRDGVIMFSLENNEPMVWPSPDE
ncbi:hypothetical protein Goklo_024977, partial [Gossypium klotzschianum]|nr:hypothetical protein [Gossypium klotzschianum]MBA0672577.1 hypothetical protein [Gossypium klotzschianum]